MNKDVTDHIRRWFNSAKYADLILPDGWFGRPHDNMLPLSYIEKRPFTTLIELSEHLLLVFTGNLVARKDGADLVLDGYSTLVFIQKEFGNENLHIYKYTHGEVIFTKE